MRASRAEAMLIGMWNCQIEIDINRPVTQVYQRLSDLGNHAEFSAALAKVAQTTLDPLAVGTRFQAEEVVPRRFVSYSEITALEPPSRIAWKAWVPGVMFTKWEFRLTAKGQATHLVQSSSWTPVGPIGFLMLNLHRKRNVPSENRRTLERIKEVLEGELRDAAAS